MKVVTAVGFGLAVVMAAVHPLAVVGEDHGFHNDNNEVALGDAVDIVDLEGGFVFDAPAMRPVDRQKNSRRFLLSDRTSKRKTNSAGNSKKTKSKTKKDKEKANGTAQKENKKTKKKKKKKKIKK